MVKLHYQSIKAQAEKAKRAKVEKGLSWEEKEQQKEHPKDDWAPPPHPTSSPTIAIAIPSP